MYPKVLVQRNQEETPYTRQRYMEFLGCKRDPFIIPVAEQESAFSGATSPPETYQKDPQEIPSLTYFIQPHSPINSKQSMVASLYQAVPAFVFGNPGMGKTSLRFAVEANCRSMSDKTLVVSYLLGRDIRKPLTISEHRRQLSKQLAIDTFIQIIERFKPGIDFPTEEQIESLRTLIWMGGRPLQRLLNHIIKEPEPNTLLKLAERWQLVGRTPIRYVARSPELLTLLEQASAIAPKDDVASDELNWDLLNFGLAAARQWQFKQIFILVDGVDNWWRDPVKMITLIKPLLQEMPLLTQQHVFFKYFLPSNLQTPIENYLSQQPKQDKRPFITTLIWDKPSLWRLLKKRFRVAGAHRRVSLNDQAPNLKEGLDNWLLDHADGSPRGLLQLISALIDEHVFACSINETGWDIPITRKEMTNALNRVKEIES